MLCHLTAETMEWSVSKIIPEFRRCAHCVCLLPSPHSQTNAGGKSSAQGPQATQTQTQTHTNDLLLVCGGFDGAATIFDDMKILDLGE